MHKHLQNDTVGGHVYQVDPWVLSNLMSARVADLGVHILPALWGRCNAGFQDYNATHDCVITMYSRHKDGKCAKLCPLTLQIKGGALKYAIYYVEALLKQLLC